MTSDGKQTFSESCLVQTAVLRTTKRERKRNKTGKKIQSLDLQFSIFSGNLQCFHFHPASLHQYLLYIFHPFVTVSVFENKLESVSPLKRDFSGSDAAPWPPAWPIALLFHNQTCCWKWSPVYHCSFIQSSTIPWDLPTTIHESLWAKVMEDGFHWKWSLLPDLQPPSPLLRRQSWGGIYSVLFHRYCIHIQLNLLMYLLISPFT